MKPSIDSIIDELLEFVPEIKQNPEEWRGFIEKFIESRPDSSLRNSFKEELKTSLLSQVERLKRAKELQPKKRGWFWQFALLGGTAFAAFLITMNVYDLDEQMFITSHQTEPMAKKVIETDSVDMSHGGEIDLTFLPQEDVVPELLESKIPPFVHPESIVEPPQSGEGHLVEVEAVNVPDVDFDLNVPGKNEAEVHLIDPPFDLPKEESIDLFIPTTSSEQASEEKVLSESPMEEGTIFGQVEDLIVIEALEDVEGLESESLDETSMLAPDSPIPMPMNVEKLMKTMSDLGLNNVDMSDFDASGDGYDVVGSQSVEGVFYSFILNEALSNLRMSVNQPLPCTAPVCGDQVGGEEWEVDPDMLVQVANQFLSSAGFNMAQLFGAEFEAAWWDEHEDIPSHYDSVADISFMSHLPLSIVVQVDLGSAKVRSVTISFYSF